jgi:hypothetical protein
LARVIAKLVGLEFGERLLAVSIREATSSGESACAALAESMSARRARDTM